MTEQTEQESIDLLTSLMVNADPEVSRRVYKKFNGDLQRAASAILENDTGEPESGTAQRPGTPIAGLGASTLGPFDLPPPPPVHKPVIDLTGDDDAEMTRALKASLEPLSNTQYGPSERPTNDWQVAIRPNTDAGSTVSHDDQQMSRAIQESLQGSFNQVADDQLETLPLTENYRKDKRPIMLRPTKASYVHSALILQALFFIPQVRIAVSRFRPSTAYQAVPDPDGTSFPAIGHRILITTPEKPEETMWSIVELFANMDLAYIAEMRPDPIIERFDVPGWTRPTDQPGRLSNVFYEKLSELVEQTISRASIAQGGSSRPTGRMFHFSYGDSVGGATNFPDVTPIVSVTVGSDGSSHDLMSCLSAQFAAPANEPQKKQNTILEPSDVVAFELISGSRVSTADKKPFSYPKVIYLDQFLQENAEIAHTVRARQRAMEEEVERLTLRKKSLTFFDNKNTLKDLRSTVYYYEQVADAKSDPVRQADIDRTGKKLKHILASIENEVKAIDEKIVQLKAESQTLFDVPELQTHGYDLRAVLVHDGLFGRKSLYSYVQDRGKWWKTLDASVTEVFEENILTDSTGLHLGAGPYLLLYSRQMPSKYDEELENPAWPPKLITEANNDNQGHLIDLEANGVDIQNFFLLPELVDHEMSDGEQGMSSRPMEM